MSSESCTPHAQALVYPRCSPEETFKDLIQYDDYFTPFTDAFGQFAVTFPHGWPMGVGPVYPRSHQHTTQPVERALTLMAKTSQGCLIGIQRQQLECYPWVTVERGILPTSSGRLQIEARHVFAGRRVLRSLFRIENQSNDHQSFAPVWTGWFADDSYVNLARLKEFEGLASVPRTAYTRALPTGVEGGLNSVDPARGLPGVAARIECTSHEHPGVWLGPDPIWKDPGAHTSQGRHFALGTQFSLQLEPGAVVTFEFSLSLASNWFRRPVFQWPETEPGMTFGNLEERARKRFLEEVGWDIPLDVSDAALLAKLWRARFALLRCGIAGDDGEFGENLACLCTADAGGFSTSFFWDTLFCSVGIAGWNRRYAQGALRTAFVRQLERDGSSPENKFNYTVPHRHPRNFPQAPVATWALLEYYRETGDLTVVRSIYRNCLENHRYWAEFADRDRDGLAEWLWTGQTADNSPLWDSVLWSKAIGWIPPIASVSLNAFLYWDADNLRAVSALLGESAQAEYFARRKESIWEAFHQVCFVEGEGRYWDYNQLTQEHRRLKTFYMFWPIVAGMPVPAEVEKDLIENVLLDEKQFFGAVPFPSVAYDEPSHEPLGYWRGKAWPHISFWLLQTLWRKGYHREADLAANRILAWYSIHKGLRENQATDTSLNEPKGQIDYNWGCAGFYLIGTRAYRRSNLWGS